MKKVRILLVAINGYGRIYSDALLDCESVGNYTVVGIVDPFAKIYPRIGEYIANGVPIFDDIDSFFGSHTADLTIISSPIHFHERQAIAALNHGSHVLCEKPIAGSLAQANNMIATAQQNNKRLSIGYQLSFAKANLALKTDLMNNRYGDIYYAKSLVLWPRDLGYYGRNNWAGKLKSNDGTYIRDSVLQNATAHYLQNLFFLLGKSIDDAATVKDFNYQAFRANDIETFDTAIVKMKTNANTDIYASVSHSVDKQINPIMEIKCELGVIYRLEDGSLIGEIGDEKVEYGNTNDYDLPLGAQGTDIKIWSMINSILNNSPHKSPAKSALTHLSCIEQMVDVKVIEGTCDNDTIIIEGLADKLISAYETMGFIDM